MFFSPPLKKGSQALAFHLLDQKGRIVSSEQIRTACGCVLLFFSSHFLPWDRQLLSAYADAYPQFQQQGIEVFAISGLNWETLYHLAEELNVPYPVLFDPCCRISNRYKTMMIPKFVTGRGLYLINHEHRILFASRVCSPQEALRQFLRSDSEPN